MKESFQTGPFADGPSDEPSAGSLSAALEALIAKREESRGQVNGQAQGRSEPVSASTTCPDPGDWVLLAAGELGGPESERLMAHASFCSTCTERLRLGLGVFADDFTPAETSQFNRLPPASVEWQKRVAAMLAATPHRAKTAGRTRLVVWAGAGAAAAVLIAMSLFLWWRQANSPEKLLAQAYTQERIFALRMPGAAYSAVTPAAHLRGNSSGGEPPDLLEAQARIERHVERSPQDLHWLQLKARSEMLEENFDPAIDILDRLLASGSVTPALLADAGMAYFQRGAAGGSENDRATALDYLRRADELNPADPVILFNEAIVMEDRGQVMNAVETWNRYLRFERDPRWLEEGRNRLAALEQKLDRLKSHRSRIDQQLATPQSMRALAADPALLASVDEELSSTELPRLLFVAYPKPSGQARASPCPDGCAAARALLAALARSLQQNHFDPWLTRFLPSESLPPSDLFAQGARALAKAIAADNRADFPAASQAALTAQDLFHAIGNTSGEERAEIERAYALQLQFAYPACLAATQSVERRNPQSPWIQALVLNEIHVCDMGPGTEVEDPAILKQEIQIARRSRYFDLEMRARNMQGALAMEAGDPETAWHTALGSIRQFYEEDHPAYRLATSVSALAFLEDATPRAHLALLLHGEYGKLLALTDKQDLFPHQHIQQAAAAIRAGEMVEAEDQMRQAQAEMSVSGGAIAIRAFLAEDEIAMANIYLGRGDLDKAENLLDSARKHISGDKSLVDERKYAAVRGQLDLARGRLVAAESLLRDAILNEEKQAVNTGAQNVNYALEYRDLYAVLAGVWLAQGRPADDVLALWERYRLRILGETVPLCQQHGLDCLKPQLSRALNELGTDPVYGQIALLDRLLIYRAGSHGVEWKSIAISRSELISYAESLERATESPTTSLDSIDEAAGRIGRVLFSGIEPNGAQHGQLFLEPDPEVGNLPWPVVQVAGQPIGLRFNLEETPSVLLRSRARADLSRASALRGRALIVGASVPSGEEARLPEVLTEAQQVARFAPRSETLLGNQAMEAQVAAALASAPALHFAGHATQFGGETRLLLAPSANAGWIDSSILRKNPPRAARLAVFSACATGKREVSWNHDMRDIVNTLASLGVPEVVATRWQIDSASAVPIMDAFYGGLARGLSVPQALTRARLALSRDPRYRHPYYWAAYYASGTGKTDLSEVFHDPGN